MHTSIRRSALLLLTLTWLATPSCVFGDFIILKDGYTLRGKLLIEGQILRDPGGKEFWIKKLGGFYVVEDGVRKIVFSTRQVSEARQDQSEREAPETFTFKPILMRTEFSPVLRSVEVDDEGAWEPNGERKITLTNDRTPGQTKTFDQCIVSLLPHYFRVSGRKIRWESAYLTNEVEPDRLLAIVRQNLEKRNPPLTALEKQLSIVRFCRQAGWFGEADAAMQMLLADFPAEKERLGEQADELRRRVNRRRLEASELALQAGQLTRIDQLLAGFPLEGARQADATRVVGLQNQMKELQAKLDSAKRQLTAVLKDVKDQKLLTDCAEAITEIQAGLNRDTCKRLDAFVLLSLQEDRNRAQGIKAKLAPEQLLALAISGWVLGDAGAETDVKSAIRLWQTRQFLVRFLKILDNRERAQALDQYVRSEAQPADVLAQIIELLPPIASPAPLPNGAVDLTTDGNRAMEYRLELPPEYHPHRSYPLLIALPNTEEEPKVMMARWSNHARDHGYILAVPRWADPLQLGYQGTEREQEVIPYVLRDVRRRFNVDPDQVFMAGFDESGKLAYDVVLARPDLFAGVVVFGAPPGKFGKSYRFNAQYLPFYVVEGEKSPYNSGGNRDLFEYWVERGFPSLYVEYGGRGLEFFPAELPYIFDWMARKRRARGLPELGGRDPEGGALGREFRTERHCDNRFYWLSSDDLTVGNNRVASITARVVANDNSILVQQAGFKQLSVWLNSSMVDFEQPVEIRVNPGSGTGKQFKGRLTPDLRILLEDFYQRGDRKNLFVARVDFK